MSISGLIEKDMQTGRSAVRPANWVASLELSCLGRTDYGQDTDYSVSPAQMRGPVRVVDPFDQLQSVRWAQPAPGALLFDGYLLGQNELAHSLECSQSDTASVLAAGYHRWGSDLFNYVDGAFLLAIWDAASRHFILGHDALSKHPVYYTIQHGVLWFSSNLLTLSQCPEVTATPNRLSLGRRLTMRPPGAGETCFEGIQRLRPGHFLRVSASGGVEEIEYWQLLPGAEENWMTEDEVLASYEQLLMRAVDQCLDLGIDGILLSGGTDSVSVAAMAVEQAKSRGLPTPMALMGKVPPGYDGGRDDLMQDTVAGLLNMPVYRGNAHEWLGGQDLLGATLSYSPVLPGPTTAYWLGAFSGFYRSVVDLGISTALSGSGGDEWMGISGAYFADLLWGRDFRNAKAFAEATARGNGNSMLPTMAALSWQWAIRFPMRISAETMVPGYISRRISPASVKWHAALATIHC